MTKTYAELNRFKGSLPIKNDRGIVIGFFEIPGEWFELLKKLTEQANAMQSVIDGLNFTVSAPLRDPDGRAVNFAFTTAPFAVFINGVLEKPIDDYSQVGPTITFKAAPNADDQIRGLLSS